MSDDEREIAGALVDYWVGGDDVIPTQEGSVTLHSLRLNGNIMPVSGSLLARHATGQGKEEYEIEIIVRRKP